VILWVATSNCWAIETNCCIEACKVVRVEEKRSEGEEAAIRS
jgi:hypothetical protein